MDASGRAGFLSIAAVFGFDSPMGQLGGFIGCCGAYHGGVASILVRL